MPGVLLLLLVASQRLATGSAVSSWTSWWHSFSPSRGSSANGAQHQLLSPLSTTRHDLPVAEGLDAVATVFDPQGVAHIPGLADAVAKKGATVASSSSQHLLGDASGDGSPSSFDLERAKRMARVTSIAYCSDVPVISAWNCTRCLRVPGFTAYEVVFDQVWDLLGFTGYDATHDAIVVAFRGTDSHSWNNWINNLKTWRANKMYPVEGHPGATVHAGFYDLWTKSSLQRNLTRAVGELVAAHPTPRLFITGHSMGAALGSLAALDLKFLHNFTEVRMWSFGSPRVGNLAWEQLYEEHVTESWRFTHNRDVVPSLPPRLLGFHHVAREAWTVDFAGPGGVIEQKILICDGTGEDPSCHNSACMLGLCTSVADHLIYLGIEMYKDALEC